MQQKIIVERSADDEMTFATITFETDKWLSDASVYRKFCDVVTKWRETTECGRQAWEESCEDFNVGDLSMYLNSIPEYIWTMHGLSHVSVEVTSLDNAASRYWTFDMVLR